MNELDKAWHEKIDERVEQTKRDYKGPHCCLTMDKALDVQKDTFSYDEEYNTYYIRYYNPEISLNIDHCTFCGANITHCIFGRAPEKSFCPRLRL